MKIYNRQQSVVFSKPTKKRKGNLSDRSVVAERRAAAAQQKRQHLEDLMGLSVAELQLALKVQKETLDLRGRLHNERSGEGERKMGMSEIERVFEGAFQAQGGDEDDPRQAIKKQPGGASPASFDQDPTTDSEDIRQDSARTSQEPPAAEKWKDRAIDSIIEKMIFDPKLNGAKCLFCTEIFMMEQGARNHLEEQYGKGCADLKAHNLLMSGVASLNSHPSMPGERIWTDDEPRGLAFLHYKGINAGIALVRKRARKSRKKLIS
jgi:hypothetical protein